MGRLAMRNNPKPSLAIFTAVNRQYELFVPSFVYAALDSNPHSKVVVGMEDPPRFIERNSEAVKWLAKRWGQRFEFVGSDFTRTIPNSVRFIDPPLRYRLCLLHRC